MTVTNNVIVNSSTRRNCANGAYANLNLDATNYSNDSTCGATVMPGWIDRFTRLTPSTSP